MKKKLQVFVSSTYVDILAERQAAVEAILRAGHIPAGMELFASGDESQWETIRRWIDDSDVFMLILGGRYGSVESESGKSYVELEYEYALRRNKPLFAAVISEELIVAKVKSIGPDAVERLNGKLLEAFRGKVTKRICRFFSNTDELKLVVFESLGSFERNEDLTGWIHGGDVVDPKALLQEVAQLRAENKVLRRQISEIEALGTSYLPALDRPHSTQLGPDARQLLVAAKNGGGYILYLQTMGGVAIKVASRNFIGSPRDREEARWKAALDELREHRLVEPSGSKGQTFRMTKRGYEVADEAEATGQDGPDPGTVTSELGHST
jgi:Domain of unknown function (DUF4062)